tara:strand:+ start:1962 stop:2780 length:819 start_codon:yes stop_codon:yes gene_type:complete
MELEISNREQLSNLLTEMNTNIENITNSTNIIIDNTKQDELTYEKKIFFKNIQNKIEKLTIRFNILRFKYRDYKKWYDLTNISIIIISTLLTIIESVKSIFTIEKSLNTTLTKTFNLLPIIFSCSISLSASILKFKKFQEKMEVMSKCIEKSISTSYRLQRIQEKIINIKTLQDLDKLKEIFEGEPYEVYANSQEEIEKNLKYKDLVTHMQTYYNLNLKYKKSFANYNYDQLKIKIIQDMQESTVEDDINSNSTQIIPKKSICSKIQNFFKR